MYITYHIIDNNTAIFQRQNLNLDTFRNGSCTLLSRVLLVRKIARDISRRHDVETCATIPCRWSRYFLVLLRFRRMRDSQTRILVGWHLRGMHFPKPTNHFYLFCAYITFLPLSRHSPAIFNRLFASLRFLLLAKSAKNVYRGLINAKLHYIDF